MKAIITSTSYAIPLTKKEWNALNEKDYLDDVNPKLVSAGADSQSINYSGFSGRYIYFTLDDSRNLNKVIQVIEGLCE